MSEPITIWWCPVCSAPEFARERRPGGYAVCTQGHRYPMSQTVKTPPAAPGPEEPDA